MESRIFGISSAAVIEATGRTLALGTWVALFSGAAGLCLAWWMARVRVPGSRWLRPMIALPYSLPPYLLAMAWVVIAHPTIGWRLAHARICCAASP